MSLNVGTSKRTADCLGELPWPQRVNGCYIEVDCPTPERRLVGLFANAYVTATRFSPAQPRLGIAFGNVNQLFLFLAHSRCRYRNNR